MQSEQGGKLRAVLVAGVFFLAPSHGACMHGPS